MQLWDHNVVWHKVHKQAKDLKNSLDYRTAMQNTTKGHEGMYNPIK